ncbi:protein tyrosine phosphatase [Malassezia pachydermatis]|uniref:Protein tyrosine phosphatase n=1 Tax=Malassezia pachydermatis TaxID=77020 RepID=A0A0M8MNL6_9BASI|nr:protein tyrosine phosphatase [Malassezia pachydermatis]KOS13727.1 protein tyrosine phosphatase [Malassezia pachydermatis]
MDVRAVNAESAGVRHTLWRPKTSEVIVPPLNFDMVAPGVYRSGHPNERNFSFLKRLNLKSIMYLASDDYRDNMVQWARREGIQVFHHRVAMNKEPFAEMDETEVASALAHLLDVRNLPVLVHCNKGKYRVGCLVGCVRRLQGWSHISILEEYARFAGDKIADEEFIEMFDLSRVQLDAAHRPTWL